MAFYRISIRKQMLNGLFGEHVWTNNYHVTAADEEGALDIAEGIVDIERAVHWSNVYFIDVAARQDSELAGSGHKRTIGAPGLRAYDDEQMLTRFNVVRVIFTDGVGRPDQKYLRLPCMEVESDSGTWTTDAVSFWNTNYVVPLMGLVGLVSSSHTTYTSGAVWQYVQMRQESWSRRSRPGFKRGYVPA